MQGALPQWGGISRRCRCSFHAIEQPRFLGRYCFRVNRAVPLERPVGSSQSSNSTLSSGQADSSALTREATGGAGDRSGRKRRRSRSPCEHGVDARLELYAADGRLFHLFGRSSSKRLWRSPGRAVHPRRPVEDSRRGGQRRLIGGYRPMTRSSCRSRTPAGTSAIAPSRILVSSGEEARATRAAAREPSTRRRARGARSRS